MEENEAPKSVPKKRRRLSNDDFDECFEDLSALPEFKGPKLPSRRQSLRMFLQYFQTPGDKDDAAQITVTKVLEQHASNGDVKMQCGQLVAKLKASYDDLKYVIASGKVQFTRW